MTIEHTLKAEPPSGLILDPDSRTEDNLDPDAYQKIELLCRCEVPSYCQIDAYAPQSMSQKDIVEHLGEIDTDLITERSRPDWNASKNFAIISADITNPQETIIEDLEIDHPMNDNARLTENQKELEGLIRQISPDLTLKFLTLARSEMSGKVQKQGC